MRIKISLFLLLFLYNVAQLFAADQDLALLRCDAPTNACTSIIFPQTIYCDVSKCEQRLKLQATLEQITDTPETPNRYTVILNNLTPATTREIADSNISFQRVSSLILHASNEGVFEANELFLEYDVAINQFFSKLKFPQLMSISAYNFFSSALQIYNMFFSISTLKKLYINSLDQVETRENFLHLRFLPWSPNIALLEQITFLSFTPSYFISSLNDMISSKKFPNLKKLTMNIKHCPSNEELKEARDIIEKSNQDIEVNLSFEPLTSEEFNQNFDFYDRLYKYAYLIDRKLPIISFLCLNKATFKSKEFTKWEEIERLNQLEKYNS